VSYQSERQAKLDMLIQLDGAGVTEDELDKAASVPDETLGIVLRSLKKKYKNDDSVYNKLPSKITPTEELNGEDANIREKRAREIDEEDYLSNKSYDDDINAAPQTGQEFKSKTGKVKFHISKEQPMKYVNPADVPLSLRPRKRITK
jgi:hypothetical protein